MILAVITLQILDFIYKRFRFQKSSFVEPVSQKVNKTRKNKKNLNEQYGIEKLFYTYLK